MISKLEIKGFQAHECFSLDLAPGVTTIVGSSDRGKSSILRAIRWACQNKPRGAQIIRRGSKAARVSLEVDGRRIMRARGKAKNTCNVDGETLRAFGTEPPAEASRLLNVSDLNFAGQHDPTFWFAKSPGEVSRELNAIVDLGAIDRCLGRLAARGRETAAEAKVATQRLAAVRAERGRLWLARGATRALAALEGAQQALDSQVARGGALRGLAGDAWAKAGEAERAGDEEFALTFLTSAGNHWENVSKSAREMAGLLEQASAFRQTVAAKVPDPGALVVASTAWPEISREASQVGTLVAEARHLMVGARESNREAERCAGALKRASSGRECPLCGRGGPKWEVLSDPRVDALRNVGCGPLRRGPSLGSGSSSGGTGGWRRPSCSCRRPTSRSGNSRSGSKSSRGSEKPCSRLRRGRSRRPPNSGNLSTARCA